MSLLNIIGTGISALTAIKSNKSANDAVDQQGELNAAEIARNERIMELYGEGSVEMQAALDKAMGGAGNFAEISPENFATLRNYFASERQIEEDQNADTVYGRDTESAENGASTFDMARDVDRVAEKFIRARMANAGRAVDETMSRGQADLYSRGMDNSTLDVQLRRSAADMKSQAYNKAMLDGVDDAMSYVKGVQNISSNEQGMDINERQYGQELIRNVENMSSDTALNDFNTGNSVMNSQSSIYTDYAARMAEMASAPYKFAADGQTSANFGNALASANDMSARSNQNAIDAGGAFGTWVDRTFGYNDRTPIA
jgi:hypothetical protein